MAHRDILLAIAALVAPSQAQAADSPDVIRWRGDGTQIYSCQKSQDTYAWVLKRPDAVLTDTDGLVRGHHGAGPSWTATDGSGIVGRLITVIPAPRADAIPWLVLQADTHDGPGMLNGVTYVLRTETVGGVAPSSGCDADREGATATIPYRATYSFLRPIDGPERPVR
jgi:hypothetical protein